MAPFTLIEVIDDLDKVRLQLAVCGGNAEAEARQTAFDIRINIADLDACIDIIPASSMLIKIAEEGVELNTLLVPAGRVKEGGPLMGYFLPAGKGSNTRTGIFSSVESAFDLAFCFQPAEHASYTAYVDDSVLQDGSAAWPLQETSSLGGDRKYFTLTKVDGTAVLAISS